MMNNKFRIKPFMVTCNITLTSSRKNGQFLILWLTIKEKKRNKIIQNKLSSIIHFHLNNSECNITLLLYLTKK